MLVKPEQPKDPQREQLEVYIDTDLSFAHILSKDDREELIDLLVTIEDNGRDKGYDEGQEAGEQEEYERE